MEKRRADRPSCFVVVSLLAVIWFWSVDPFDVSHIWRYRIKKREIHIFVDSCAAKIWNYKTKMEKRRPIPPGVSAGICVCRIRNELRLMLCCRLLAWLNRCWVPFRRSLDFWRLPNIDISFRKNPNKNTEMRFDKTVWTSIEFVIGLWCQNGRQEMVKINRIILVAL